MKALNPARLKSVNALIERLTPRQRQFALLGLLMAVSVGILWLIFALDEKKAPALSETAAKPSGVTNIGVMAPGQQVNPLDQWVGNAGKKLAQYESEREEQSRLNRERTEFEKRTMQRFSELEQKLATTDQPNAEPVPPAPMPVLVPEKASPSDEQSLIQSERDALLAGFPPNEHATPPVFEPVTPPTPIIVRVSVTPLAAAPEPNSPNTSAPENKGREESRTVATYLPVSVTRGQLLGGLDAPTGGQAQSNPHPVLIRLSDNAVLPNLMRGQYRDCFVIAAGYGDISSERAYLRTESLSCVRQDGSTLEVSIQGSVYGEDGKVGLRGRLVTKQGQMLANALLAGVVSGIGQGLATSSSETSTSALGTVSTLSGSDAYRAGIGTGVGRALDRLAQYYIRLAENTFPVIEIDAGREIDVVITRGVKIDAPVAGANTLRTATTPAQRYLEESDDTDY
ncbi:MAG: TraB/VirB10 family protein [Betaproteobacteria bacterium]|nr:TraB/VirB10 family protein [Betaproteobacteria bacterium]